MTAVTADPAPHRFGPPRAEVIAFLELFALTGLAVAQPVFDLVGKHATQLVANQRTRPQILVMTLVVVVLPAALAWALEVAVGFLVPRARRSVHVGLLALVVGVIGVEAFKSQTGWGTLALVGAGALCGSVAAVLLWRFDLARRFVRYLAVAPVAFAAIFVFLSPVSDVLFADQGSSANTTIGKPARVVMIQLDEFPVDSLLDGTGHVDATLFPNFAALAGTSNWYRNTTTVSPVTETAVPAIATGLMPTSQKTPPIAADYPHSIYTLLGGRYRMNVHETITHLCPASICPPVTTVSRAHPGLVGLFRDTFQTWEDFASPERQANDVSQAFSVEGQAQLALGPFIRSLAPSSGPVLDYVHVLLPHQGWHFVRSGQDNTATFETGQFSAAHLRAIWPDAASAAVGRQRHLLQLQYTDVLLGRVIARLKEIGAYDRSLVVVTADHGVAFTAPEPVRGLSARNAPQIAWVPLFIKLPGQTRGLVSDQPVRTTDIVPTIADVLDARVPWKLDGRSVLGRPRRAGRVPLLPWSEDTLQPSGHDRDVTIDGVSGFAAAMAGRATSVGGDPALRLYRLGPYGGLVGSAVAGRPSGPASNARATIRNAAKFDSVDPAAHLIPWTWIGGYLAGVAPGRTVAVAVDGVVAGTSVATRDQRGDLGYWAVLAPQYFRLGRDEIALFLLSGPATAPVLTPIPVG